MKNLSFYLILAILVSIFAGCTEKEFNWEAEPGTSLKSSALNIKIAVISDIHYANPELLPEDIENNVPFKNYLAADANKLTEISDPIFRKVVEEMKEEMPDILLVAGDLTKDGEKLNHLTVRDLLQELSDLGIQIFVVPGNNDINNPESKSFAGEVPVSVPTITKEEFAEIYQDFGYNSAERDPNSLSYLCKPYPGLWILGIDACKYSPKFSRSGAIKPATLAWIQEKLADAGENDTKVLALMHHGIMEHFEGNTVLNPGTVVDNWQTNVQALCNAGIKLVFTGHNHGNDICEYSFEGKTIFDIETGSLITPVSPYRIMELDENYIKIDTRQVTSIDYELPENLDFITYSQQTIYARLVPFYNKALQSMFGIPAGLAQEGAPFITKAVMTQCAGDEWISPAESSSIESLAEITPPENQVLIYALNCFWNDLPPKDNKIHIKLK